MQAPPFFSDLSQTPPGARGEARSRRDKTAAPMAPDLQSPAALPNFLAKFPASRRS
jgi:hypothetical protein